MQKAPIISTIIAFALIPIAFLYIHAYISAIKKRRSHPLTGFLAIVGDLTISICYMLYRSIGGSVSGSSISLTGNTLIYFIIHGSISLIVIILEIIVLINGLLSIRRKVPARSHRLLGRLLFFIWWLAFLTGEIFYVVTYLI
jgi:uncharacterized membrane protein YozB (DUF420 family)